MCTCSTFISFLTSKVCCHFLISLANYAFMLTSLNPTDTTISYSILMLFYFQMVFGCVAFFKKLVFLIYWVLKLTIFAKFAFLKN